MGRKREDVGSGDEDLKPLGVRNRASPFGLTKLYNGFNDAQKQDFRNMEFTSFLHINTTKLHNKSIDWLASCYDPAARCLLIPSKGRIPMTEESVYNALGCPHGTEPVPYKVDKDIEARLAPEMFPDMDLSKAPLHSQVNTMLKNMTESGDRFKRLTLMYIMSTILAPTTSTRISNRCYSVLDDIANVHKYNFCKFVLDQLHKNLSKKKLNKGCRLYLLLLYVDSLDISELGLLVPSAPFGVTAWTNNSIDEVMKADTKEDGSFGKLQLACDHAMNYTYFGGPEQFSRWIDLNSHPDITPKMRNKVETVVGQFASGMTCLLGNLVQGWTGLTPPESEEMTRHFAIVNGGVPTRSLTARGRFEGFTYPRDIDSDDNEQELDDDDSRDNDDDPPHNPGGGGEGEGEGKKDGDNQDGEMDGDDAHEGKGSGNDGANNNDGGTHMDNDEAARNDGPGSESCGGGGEADAGASNTGNPSDVHRDITKIVAAEPNLKRQRSEMSSDGDASSVRNRDLQKWFGPRVLDLQGGLLGFIQPRVVQKRWIQPPSQPLLLKKSLKMQLQSFLFLQGVLLVSAQTRTGHKMMIRPTQLIYSRRPHDLVLWSKQKTRKEFCIHYTKPTLFLIGCVCSLKHEPARLQAPMLQKGILQMRQTSPLRPLMLLRWNTPMC